MPPVAGLGYNKQWPGPTIRVEPGRQGPRRRSRTISRRRPASTSTASSSTTSSRTACRSSPSCRSSRAQTYAYEFTAKNAGLADVPLAPQRDRPGRPRPAGRVHRRPEARPDARPTANTSGSRTTSSAGSRSTATASRRRVPVLAAVGETVRIRFMNEGIMMHPWHLHGLPMRVVARDGMTSGAPRSRATRWASTRANGGTSRSKASTPRHLGLPLPHPAARRGVQRDVRDGQHHDRRAREGATSTRSSRRWSPSVLEPLASPNRPSGSPLPEGRCTPLAESSVAPRHRLLRPEAGRSQGSARPRPLHAA